MPEKASARNPASPCVSWFPTETQPTKGRVVKRGMARLLGTVVLGAAVVVGTSTSANAATWVYHSHYPTKAACEQAWQDMHAGSPVAEAHECRPGATAWQLWYVV